MRDAAAFGAWFAVTLLPFASAAVMSGRTRLPGGFKLMLVLTLGMGILTLNLLASGICGGINLWRVGAPQLVLLAIILAIRPEARVLAFQIPKSASATDPVTVIGLVAWAVGLFGLLIAATHAAPAHDAAGVHLPMAHWIKDYGLLHVPSDIPTATRPAGFAMLYSWALCGSSRLELLALQNVAFSLVLALATFNICRVLGCSRKVSIWAPVLVFGNYLLIDQVRTLYIDTTFASLLLAAFGFGLAHWRRPSLESLLGSGVAFGLAMGGKMQGVLYLPILALFILVPYTSERLRICAWCKARMLVQWGAVALLLCGFWPLRNAVFPCNTASDPRYSMEFTVRTALLFNLPAYIAERGLQGFTRDVAGQTSWAAAASIVPLLMLPLTVGSVARRLGSERRLLAVFATAALMSLALLLVHPCTSRHFADTPLLVGGQLRYGVFTFALMSVCWVLLLSRRSVWLLVLCLGLALPGSRTATTLGLASGGFIAALARRSSNVCHHGGSR